MQPLDNGLACLPLVCSQLCARLWQDLAGIQWRVFGAAACGSATHWTIHSFILMPWLFIHHAALFLCLHHIVYSLCKTAAIDCIEQ